MKLSERDRAFLMVLLNEDEPIYAGRVFHLAYPDAPHAGRRDAGATRTLRSLERRGLVSSTYHFQGRRSESMRWWITGVGREAVVVS